MTSTADAPVRKLPMGRRAPNPEKVAKGILDFTPLIRTDVEIPIPATADYLAELSGKWLMLGNGPDPAMGPDFEGAGDCEAVRVANDRLLTTTYLGAEPHYPDLDVVWAIYKLQNPGFDPHGSPDTDGPGSSHDGGMDTQTLLEDLQEHGIPGGNGTKVICFGQVDPTNIPAVEAAIAIFGGVWVDILVLDGNQQEFSEGKPWTDVSGSGIDGGHAVLSGGYVPQRKFITWAAETEFADSFWNGQTSDGALVESVWVVVWPEHTGSKGFLAGVDGEQLASEFSALTDKPFPVDPTPEPTPPVPAPTPTPAPPAPDADQALAAVAESWVAMHHTGANRVMQRALEAWLTSRGSAIRPAVYRD